MGFHAMQLGRMDEEDGARLLRRDGACHVLVSFGPSWVLEECCWPDSNLQANRPPLGLLQWSLLALAVITSLQRCSTLPGGICVTCRFVCAGSPSLSFV